MNEELIRRMFSQMVNQSLVNRENRWEPLPESQQKALDKLLDAVHDFAKSYSDNTKEIDEKYKAQTIDAMILKAASEMGWQTGDMK